MRESVREKERGGREREREGVCERNREERVCTSCVSIRLLEKFVFFSFIILEPRVRYKSL